MQKKYVKPLAERCHLEICCILQLENLNKDIKVLQEI